MKLTLAEAKLTICHKTIGPVLPTSLPKPIGAYGVSSEYRVVPSNCLGNTCGAWRWTAPATDPVLGVIPLEHRRGYCGLAGVPTE